MRGSLRGFQQLSGSWGPGRAGGRQQRRLQVVRADSDYYQILGVSRSADKKEIKSAYRLGFWHSACQAGLWVH